MESLRKKSSGMSGGTAARTLFFCVLLIAIALAVASKDKLSEKFQSIRAAGVAAVPAQATPTPALAQATPEPVSQAAAQTPEPPPLQAATEPTPSPTPEPTATPAPVPAVEPLEFDTLAQTSAWWPKQVALVKPISFPIVFNGKVAGQAQIPSGMVLNLKRVIAGNPGQIEVEYQNSRKLIPAESTDLFERAMALRKTASTQPATETSAMPSFHTPPPAPNTSQVVAPPTPPISGNQPKFKDRVTAEVVRSKKTRIEGGDWDDKTDRIVLKVKLTNSDPKIEFNNLKGEIYIFAKGIVDSRSIKLLGSEKFDFSLSARGEHELQTHEVVTAYDTTDARFGYQYQGWIVRIRDASGALLLEKATNTTLSRNAAELVKLQVNAELRH